MPLTPGAMFERYEIEGLVGRGGMGEVYRAVDTRLHRPVALKVIRTDAAAAHVTEATGGVQRLLREARAAAALNHANSVAIYELGEAEGIPYIAMEFVSGRSLRTLIGDDSIAFPTKLAWMADAALALAAAHRANLVHRDVKPGNIMVSHEGVVKVLDFGLAKPLVPFSNMGEFQTQMGQVLGTPRYMSPEQLEGHPADAKTDQFAFGLVAYELLSGTYPGGPLSGPPKPIHELCAAATPELSVALGRMLSRNADLRFATMEEAAATLRSCLPNAASVWPTPPLAFRKTSPDAPTQAIERTAPLATEPPPKPRPSQRPPSADARPMAPSLPVPAPPVLVSPKAAAEVAAPPARLTARMWLVVVAAFVVAAALSFAGLLSWLRR